MFRSGRPTLGWILHPVPHQQLRPRLHSTRAVCTKTEKDRSRHSHTQFPGCLGFPSLSLQCVLVYSSCLLLFQCLSTPHIVSSSCTDRWVAPWRPCLATLFYPPCTGTGPAACLAPYYFITLENGLIYTYSSAATDLTEKPHVSL